MKRYFSKIINLSALKIPASSILLIENTHGYMPSHTVRKGKHGGMCEKGKVKQKLT
jgi:hypothetical protein